MTFSFVLFYGFVQPIAITIAVMLVALVLVDAPALFARLAARVAARVAK